LKRIVCVLALGPPQAACVALDPGPSCGPARAVVERVIDGDTVVIEGGERLRSLLIERGFACVLHIPPNGTDRVDHVRALEVRAREEQRGMWGACLEVPCAN
jgi:endonuclease YncB( thermonuclease family)